MFWAHVESTQSGAGTQDERKGRARNVLLVEFINSDVACNLKSNSVQFLSGSGFGFGVGVGL